MDALKTNIIISSKSHLSAPRGAETTEVRRRRRGYEAKPLKTGAFCVINCDFPIPAMIPPSDDVSNNNTASKNPNASVVRHDAKENCVEALTYRRILFSIRFPRHATKSPPEPCWICRKSPVSHILGIIINGDHKRPISELRRAIGHLRISPHATVGNNQSLPPAPT